MTPPVTRRQSMRLAEKADSVADKEPQAQLAATASAQQPRKRDSIVGSVNGGRVTKPEVKGRAIASRYMSAATARKTEPPTRTTGSVKTPNLTTTSRAGNRAPAAARPASRVEISNLQRPKSRALAATNTRTETNRARPNNAKPVSTETKGTEAGGNHNRRATVRRDSRRATAATGRAGSLLTSHDSASGTANDDSTAGLYMTYTQWLMIEARSKIEFEENKAAASEELERLVREAEQAKRALAEEERKLKLMREYCALTTWMSANREALADMGAQIARVSEPYTKFSQSLAETTRAMPISGVYYSDGEALVDDMQKFADAVSSSFPATESNVKDLYGMASRLSRLYKALGQERELLSECDRLKQSLEHAAVLAVSSKLGSLK